METGKKPDTYGYLGTEAMALRDLLAELARKG